MAAESPVLVAKALTSCFACDLAESGTVIGTGAATIGVEGTET